MPSRPDPPEYFKPRFARLLDVPSNSGRYNAGMSWLMAELAHLAYERFETDVALLERPLAKGGFELVQWYNARRKGTQAFLALRKPGDFAVLCFRGTDQKRDWKRNLKVDRTGVGKLRIHEGFLKAFRAVEKRLVADLEALADVPVFLSGHSLGGALATLSTYLLPREPRLSRVRFRACYTVGAPRVGNRRFSAEMDRPPRVYRFVREGDVVAELPLGGRYKHAGTLYYFDRKGRVRDSIPWNKRTAKVVRGSVLHAGRKGLSAIEAHDHQAYADQLGEYALSRQRR